MTSYDWTIAKDDNNKCTSDYKGSCQISYVDTIKKTVTLLFIRECDLNDNFTAKKGTKVEKFSCRSRTPVDGSNAISCEFIPHVKPSKPPVINTLAILFICLSAALLIILLVFVFGKKSKKKRKS